MKQILTVLFSLALIFETALGAFETIANFTDNYSAVFNIYDDPVYG